MTESADAIEEASIDQLRAALLAGRVTSEHLVTVYLRRIEALNPLLNAIISINSDALAAAQACDAAHRAGITPGVLRGIPLLIKDNIETRDDMPTTAGSLALARNVSGRDAPLVKRLRDAGAIILGKTNLSEWSNIRSAYSLSGWSAMGGQTRNPFALDRSPCGSSAGSAVAAAASLAAAAIGTETNGSITFPASVCGVVGLKPTVGLVSRRHVVPISHSQDTAGPLTRCVRDAALLLTVLAGSDPHDPATREADGRRQQYMDGLTPDALAGVRLGVLNFAAGFHPLTTRVFKDACHTLSAAGATLVEIDSFPGDRSTLGKLEIDVLLTELKAGLNSYLATTRPESVSTRTLADVIAFNREHAAAEMALFGQDLFEAAEATCGLDDPAYLQARFAARNMAGPEGIDRMLRDNDVAALVAPTLGPSWLIDPILKDHFLGGGSSSAAAIAGYPHLSVPMGQIGGLPVGLSWIGPAWSDRVLLRYAYAFEQAAGARRVPRFAPTAALGMAVDDTPLDASPEHRSQLWNMAG